MKTAFFSVFLSVLLLKEVAGFAQSEPAPLRVNLDFEKLEWINSWFNSSNASGLTKFSELLPEFESFSSAKLIYDHASGEFRCPKTPPTLTNIGFRTRSVRRINQLFLEGYFNYDLSNRRDAQWNGLYVTGSNPFFMADSIKGQFRSETFGAGARVAHPIGKNQVVGLGMDYIAGRGAKNRDLRNENRYSNFAIRPSWLLNLEAWTIGATVGWNRVFENIEYNEIASDVQAKLFFTMWGNWFFDAGPFTQTTENSRRKKDNIYSGYIQLQYSGTNFSIYNEFGLELKESSQYFSLASNRQFGDVESTTIKNNLIVHAFENHRLSVGFRYRYLTGFRPVQIVERDPETMLNVWQTIDRNLIFESIESKQNMTYSFLSRRDGDMHIRWQLDVGASHFQREQIFHHSIEFVQRISNMEFFTAFNKNFNFGNSSVDVRPLVAFRTGNGEKNETPLTGTGNARQLTAQMEQEFYALTCDKLRLQLMLRYSHPIGNQGARAFAFVNYDFLKPLGTDKIFNNQTRNLMTFGLGISF